ncbi:MAG: SPOR domain-containing protein [bacterium]
MFETAKRFLKVLLLSALALGCGDGQTGHQHGTPALESFTSVSDSILGLNPLSVQVAALADSGNVVRLAGRLRASNLPVFVSSGPEDELSSLFRVRVGPFANETEASKALAAVKQLGFLEAFIHNHTDEITAGETPTLVAAADTVVQELPVSKKRLTSHGRCSFPRWSPTGREIAFLKDENGAKGLYAVGTGGGRFSKIVEKNERFEITGEFAWSPDGQQIAFVANEITSGFQRVETLYVVNKDGSGLNRLLNQSRFAFRIKNLTWAPNKRHIAFEATFGRTDDSSDEFQRVKVLRLAQSAFAQGLLDMPGSRKTQRLVGWQSARTLLFLSSYDENRHGDFFYEVRGFDVETRQESVLRRGPAVRNCRSATLLPDSSIVICTAFSNLSSRRPARIVSLNLTSGEKVLLCQADREVTFLSDAVVAPNGEVFFIYQQQLWVNHATGRKAMIDIDVSPAQFTVSPSGSRICFRQDGDLFTLKLATK